MARYIDVDKLINEIDEWLSSVGDVVIGKGLSYYGELMGCIEDTPTADVVEVVRCKDCWYYHKAHILCNDKTEKDISEFPKESIDFTGGFVTSKYGINVGGKCELEKNCGYAEDKSVFREPNDFCSRGQALKGGA